MRTLLLLSAVFAAILVLGCDSKPAQPPTPKVDAPAVDTPRAPSKKAEPREESPGQTGY